MIACVSYVGVCVKNSGGNLLKISCPAITINKKTQLRLILTRRKFAKYVIFFIVPEIINKTKKFNTGKIVLF